MKSCKDCLWCKPYGFLFKDYTYAKCTHPSHMHLDLVSGKHVLKRAYCNLERGGGQCGKDGKNWESKK